MTERYEIAYREVGGDKIAYGIADKETGLVFRCMETGLSAYDTNRAEYDETLAKLAESVAKRNAWYAELLEARKEVLGI